MKECRFCGTQNPDNQDLCLNCSQDLPDGHGATAKGPEPDQRNTTSGDHLQLVVRAGLTPGREYPLNLPHMTLGRRDEEQGYYPDIDLYDQEKEGEWTVSRNHARFSKSENIISISDLGSANGTYVNSTEPLQPHTEVEIQPGDVLAFGRKIVLKIKG